MRMVFQIIRKMYFYFEELYQLGQLWYNFVLGDTSIGLSRTCQYEHVSISLY